MQGSPPPPSLSPSPFSIPNLIIILLPSMHEIDAYIKYALYSGSLYGGHAPSPLVGTGNQT